MNNLISIIILIAILIIITGYTAYLSFISFRKANKQATRKRFERVQFLFDKLENGQSVTQSDVYDFAKNKLTRESAFQLLQSRNLEGLFPDEFYTMERAAESNHVKWLEFATELGTCPDEIEYLKKVTIDFDGQNNCVYYHVYKFKVNHPHWAASNGWMLGVVGPYFADSKPYDHPNATFSRLRSILVDVNKADEEAKWVHENISVLFMNNRA